MPSACFGAIRNVPLLLVQWKNTGGTETKNIKNLSPFHGEKPLMITWFLGKKPHQISQSISHGRDAILRVCVKWLIFNIVSQLWADVKYHVPTGFFRRRRAVFILLAMPPTSLGRAALVMWFGRFKLRLEIRHATALTTGAKHWHR